MRNRRRLAVITLTVATLLLGPATAAGASSSSLIAYWGMNDSPGSHTMADGSGNGHRGRIGTEVHTGVRISGATGFRFDRLEPDTPPTHPAHLVTVPDSNALNPGNRDYAVTIRLRTTEFFGNIIQKGQATVPGGNFKMQIPNGIVQCFFRGSDRTILAQSTRHLNDGHWHTVRCDRTSDALTMTVDGTRVARTPGWTGRIANSWPLTIGGKVDCDQKKVGCDYYAGDLDYAEIQAY
jgi:hypothetical protein